MWLLSTCNWPSKYCMQNLGRLYSDPTGCAGPMKATAMGAGPSQRHLLSLGRLITKKEGERQGFGLE